ncbi:MAG: response regulator [Chloroflexi bacterium]|nr:response regulator [Chloroflexota bacterium]MBP7042089.1 response regulator [Chloroflexota bacterium]
MQPISILLIEDNPGDVRLTMEALKEGKILNQMSVVADGIEAIDLLKNSDNQTRPDLIMLDLSLPRMSGLEVLAAIKGDDALRPIPVVILTTSDSEQDILDSYNMHANCYVTKPVDLDQFIKVVRSIEEFWLTVVQLPTTNGR